MILWILYEVMDYVQFVYFGFLEGSMMFGIYQVFINLYKFIFIFRFKFKRVLDLNERDGYINIQKYSVIIFVLEVF